MVELSDRKYTKAECPECGESYRVRSAAQHIGLHYAAGEPHPIQAKEANRRFHILLAEVLELIPEGE